MHLTDIIISPAFAQGTPALRSSTMPRHVCAGAAASALAAVAICIGVAVPMARAQAVSCTKFKDTGLDGTADLLVR